jgi:hypothetical protein
VNASETSSTGTTCSGSYPIASTSDANAAPKPIPAAESIVSKRKATATTAGARNSATSDGASGTPRVRTTTSANAATSTAAAKAIRRTRDPQPSAGAAPLRAVRGRVDPLAGHRENTSRDAETR